MGMYQIPDGLTEEDVLFVGDILSTGYFGAENGSIKPGDTIAVMGSGPVGMCAMMCARLFGPAKIIAVDMDQSRLEVAIKQGLADIAINPSTGNAIETIKELSSGRGADVVIEAVGVKGTYRLALDAVRPGGTVSILGVYEQAQELPMNELWIKNIKISMGLVNANRIPELINQIREGKLSTNFLITHRSPLNDVMTGYDVFGNKKDDCLKWVISPFEH
jgi:alcohol dehydrogenase